MICRFCDSTIGFEPAENGFPNVLKCPSCTWFYEWRPDGLGGNPTREQVENALKQCSNHDWLGLSARRLFIWDGSTELPGSAPVNDDIPF